MAGDNYLHYYLFMLVITRYLTLASGVGVEWGWSKNRLLCEEVHCIRNKVIYPTAAYFVRYILGECYTPKLLKVVV